MTNCNHKHGLMLAREAALFYRYQSVHVDWYWPTSRENDLKINWSVKIPLHWLIVGAAGS